MGYDIALVVLTYNSDLCKTIATLESARMQLDVRFKVIVVDDGSANNNFDVLRRYVSKAGFDACELLDRDVNVGTVRNLMEALGRVDAPYVKPISPGDYLYGRDSLRAIYTAMRAGNLGFCFGRAAYYRSLGGEIELLGRHNPIVLAPYIGRDTNHRAIRRNQFRHRDFILGASAAYHTEALFACLDLLAANSIRLCEDYSMQLMLMELEPFAFIDKYLLWYEVGTGVSTDPLSEHRGVMQSDSRNAADLLFRLYPEDPDVRAFHRRMDGLWENDVVSKLRRAIRDPRNALFSLRRRVLRLTARPPQVDVGNYYEIVGSAQEWVRRLTVFPGETVGS